jgi:hypothetical protein
MTPYLSRLPGSQTTPAEWGRVIVQAGDAKMGYRPRLSRR